VRLLIADRGGAVYERGCPTCGLILAYSVDDPPGPRLVRRWFDRIEWARALRQCPQCDEELPEGPEPVETAA
jgi:hypothetical protein